MTAKTAALYEEVIERIQAVSIESNRVRIDPERADDVRNPLTKATTGSARIRSKIIKLCLIFIFVSVT